MSYEQNYSPLDRLLHRVAFASPAMQSAAADIETALYGRRFRDIALDRPIFLTSLPRAGTTVLLDVLSRSPRLAVHRYRDMPFVMTPLLWEGLSRRFWRPSQARERAHGDGVLVGFESAEAFEEVVWRAFWTHKFKRDRIELWAENETDEEFTQLFTAHLRKIVAVRSSTNDSPRRYISKNNANIARIGFLRRLFPDSRILVPFRDPVDQAVSLLHQHRRFLAIHRKESFSRRYMEDIGHFEFGELHRPIDFDGVDDMIARYPSDTLEYWIAYWLAAFTHILRQRDDVLLVSYERCCEAGATTFRAVAETLDLPDANIQAAASDSLRPPRRYGRDLDVRDDLLARARDLHQRLLDLSVA